MTSRLNNTNGRDEPPRNPTLADVIAAGLVYAILFLLATIFLHHYIITPEKPPKGSAAPTTGQATQAVGAATLSSTQKKDLIQAIAFTLGGGAAVAGVYFTWKTLQTTLWSSKRAVEQTQETLRQDQVAQSADRFIRAVDQIGDTSQAKRLGGIYALHQIAKDNVEYRGRIVEVLSAYIRTNYRWPEELPPPQPRPDESQSEPTSSLQAPDRFEKSAVIKILKQSLTKTARPYAPLENPIEPLDLHRTDLRNVDLRQTDLEDATLTQATLHAANLADTHLKNADLSYSDLRQSVLTRASLQSASFKEATLQYSVLESAEDWNRIRNLEKANVDRVQNAPMDFVEWAKAKGAVAEPSHARWQAMLSGSFERIHTFVGEVPGMQALVAIEVVSSKPGAHREVQAYLCDGRTLNERFKASIEDHTVRLTSEHEYVLKCDITVQAVTGTVARKDGLTFSFEAKREKRPVAGRVDGLYHVHLSTEGRLFGAFERRGQLALLEGQVASEELATGVLLVSIDIRPLRGQIRSLRTYTNSRPETSNLYLIVLPDGRNKGGPKEGFDTPFINSDLSEHS